jgi:hypothetical protein
MNDAVQDGYQVTQNILDSEVVDVLIRSGGSSSH